MKIHEMNLTPSPMKMIRDGKKTIELRLYDEKRKQISIGDIITFTNTEDKSDQLSVRVEDFFVFDSFEELYKNLPLLECGYSESDIDSASPDDMDVYYPREKQRIYGVIGIKISNTVRKINVGQSGADVFELNESQILKHVLRARINNGMFDTYVKEAFFYKSECPKAYLPEVSDIEMTSDEIIIVMNKYRNLDSNCLNDELLIKIANVLACIHSEPIPEFLAENDMKSTVLSEDDINGCIEGWYSVLDEHPGIFDHSQIDIISQNINDIIRWHDSEKRRLSHGDFHWDNILTNDTGAIVVCDWQGVGVHGASEDLSFFISRLNADGVSIDSLSFLKWYSFEYNRLTGESLEPNELERHIKASNVITTFRFWHFYLHGSDTERVKEIFGKMLSDYRECRE